MRKGLEHGLEVAEYAVGLYCGLQAVVRSLPKYTISLLSGVLRQPWTEKLSYGKFATNF